MNKKNFVRTCVTSAAIVGALFCGSAANAGAESYSAGVGTVTVDNGGPGCQAPNVVANAPEGTVCHHIDIYGYPVYVPIKAPSGQPQYRDAYEGNSDSSTGFRSAAPNS